MQVATLEEKFGELNRNSTETETSFQKASLEKHMQLSAQRKQIEQYIEELKHLVQAKSVLEVQVEEYKMLLDFAGPM